MYFGWEGGCVISDHAYHPRPIRKVRRQEARPHVFPITRTIRVQSEKQCGHASYSDVLRFCESLSKYLRICVWVGGPRENS